MSLFHNACLQNWDCLQGGWQHPRARSSKHQEPKRLLKKEKSPRWVVKTVGARMKLGNR